MTSSTWIFLIELVIIFMIWFFIFELNSGINREDYFKRMTVEKILNKSRYPKTKDEI